MNVFLAHLPVTPIIYGIVLAASFLIWRWRWNRGDYGHIGISVLILIVLFWMHGHHAETRMGAALAVVIIDIVFAIRTIAHRN